MCVACYSGTAEVGSGNRNAAHLGGREHALVSLAAGCSFDKLAYG